MSQYGALDVTISSISLLHLFYFVAECLYNTEQQLFKRLKYFCLHPASARSANISLQVFDIAIHTLVLLLNIDV